MSDRTCTQESADRLTFSIGEFCRTHGVSRAFFYKLAKEGKAPRIMRLGARRLISQEAAADWRRAMEGGQ
jgi:predicted DNA-binding transcriptional regulator AlpA